MLLILCDFIIILNVCAGRRLQDLLMNIVFLSRRDIWKSGWWYWQAEGEQQSGEGIKLLKTALSDEEYRFESQWCFVFICKSNYRCTTDRHAKRVSIQLLCFICVNIVIFMASAFINLFLPVLWLKGERGM